MPAEVVPASAEQENGTASNTRNQKGKDPLIIFLINMEVYYG